jgi:hypothetical protein
MRSMTHPDRSILYATALLRGLAAGAISARFGG